jgi:hypothetical protein
MPVLYHFSEDPAIRRFEPRSPLAHPDAPARIWAIDEHHAPLYYFPAECPRVAFWPLPTSDPQEVRTLFPGSSTRMVIAIEHSWLPRILATRLYRYGMPTASFISCEDHGVYVSKEAVAPIDCLEIDSSLTWLARSSVELRICPSLVPLAEQLLDSTLHYSLIRMRNVIGWNKPPGTPCIEPQ